MAALNGIAELLVVATALCRRAKELPFWNASAERGGYIVSGLELFVAVSLAQQASADFQRRYRGKTKRRVRAGC